MMSMRKTVYWLTVAMLALRAPGVAEAMSNDDIHDRVQSVTPTVQGKAHTQAQAVAPAVQTKAVTGFSNNVTANITTIQDKAMSRIGKTGTGTGITTETLKARVQTVAPTVTSKTASQMRTVAPSIIPKAATRAETITPTVHQKASNRIDAIRNR